MIGDFHICFVFPRFFFEKCAGWAMHIEALHILCGIAYDICWELMTS